MTSLSYLQDRAREFSARPPQLSDSVASYIRDLILYGEVRSGEYLRVERISKDMGVSMTPVREALAALRREGFVDQEPRRGFIVAPLTPRDVRDLFSQQAEIAGELAARAVETMDQNEFQRLVHVQEALEDAAVHGASEDVERFNFEFHRIINKSSDSAKLEWILGMLVRYAPRRFFTNIPGWSEISVREHRQIIRSFRTRDSDETRAATIAHVIHSGNTLADHLEAKENRNQAE